MHKDPIQSLFIGSKLIELPSCHSTNQVASDLLSGDKVAHGTVILTYNQTAGKGQRGNKWESEPGKNLTLSAIVRPDFLPVVKQFDLTVISSLAIVSSLEDLGLPDARIKWPNDIYYQGAKIAGILIENIVRANQLEWAVLGIGLNVNQMVFQVENATSISLESGCERDLLRVRKILLGRLNQYYQMLKMSAFHELRENYTRSLMWINQERTFRERGSDKTFQGIITMVTESGKLVIRNQQQETCYDFKEIVFIG